MHTFHKYDLERTYDFNYEHAPDPMDVEIPSVPGAWDFCGLPVDSPLGIPAGPLLNGRWVLYYASLGFDILTYKTVRSGPRACYPLPNLQPVRTGQLSGDEPEVPATSEMSGSWAVSFGMPSKSPDVWRADVEETRQQLPSGKLLVVSVVGTVQDGWSMDELADDYAQCARWAVDSGADAVETNFSCPNVSTCDGQLYQEFEAVRTVTSRVRQAIGSVPYVIKVGHVEQPVRVGGLLDAAARSVNGGGMTNSIATRVVDDDGQLLFDGQRRGICGDATRQASLRQTALFAEQAATRNMDLCLIGVGGAGNAEHVRDYLLAGAGAVELATAAMVDPGVGLRIRRDWPLVVAGALEKK
ncbi:MAG: hypothetical protein ACC645_18575 [Pirellulales bacterium]